MKAFGMYYFFTVVQQCTQFPLTQRDNCASYYRTQTIMLTLAESCSADFIIFVSMSMCLTLDVCSYTIWYNVDAGSQTAQHGSHARLSGDVTVQQ